MDSVAALLDGPRARGAHIFRSVLDPPWSLRVEDRAPLTVVTLVRGHAWLVPDGGEPARLAAGAVAVVRGPDPYTVADDPATPPQAVVRSGQYCTTSDGQALTDLSRLGVRTWGTSPHGSTVVLSGTYELGSEVSRRLLAALPPTIVLPAESWDELLVPYLAAELVRDEPGQEAVLDRVLDLVLVAALRAWFARPGAEAPGWYRAHGDSVVGPALRLIQHDPARRWTVASLAAASGVSRATLARRFTELVGEPPMAFLTSWRLTLAADLLLEPDATVDAVARQVGYGSGFALSAAFTRARGVSPRTHRERSARRTQALATS